MPAAKNKVPLETVARAYCEDGKLSLDDKVGEGAFKETFRVVSSKRSPYALKIFKATGPDKRSSREIQALRRCSHNNIARLEKVETFELDGTAWLIVLEEFLSGGTLSSRIEAEGVISFDELVHLAFQLIDALVHIADLGLVHRDIKPDNILFRDARTPVLVDFGLVRDLHAESLTATGQLPGPGTPLFASPEQLLNQKPLIDWRSDQFSLGVSLSQAAFGFHPYEEAGETPSEIIERVSGRGKPVGRFTEAISDRGAHSLLRMVAPWPVHRFRTPQSLRDAWSQGMI